MADPARPGDLARPGWRRKSDTLARLENDADCWVASADADGNAYLVPLSFAWDGTVLITATGTGTRTIRNLSRATATRLALGDTRDVVIIDGQVTVYGKDEVPRSCGDAFAARNWDARQDTEPYSYVVVRPTRIQAWREEVELVGRTIMRNGTWLV